MMEDALPFSTPAWKAGKYVSSMSWLVTTAGNELRPVSSEYAA